MGDVASFNWNISFPCNIYSDSQGDQEKKSRLLYEIHTEIKKMEERRDKLNSLLEVHTTYPALNYFTNKQCLLLQKYFYQRDRNLLRSIIALLRLTPGRKNMTMKTAHQFIDFILKNSATIDNEKRLVVAISHTLVAWFYSLNYSYFIESELCKHELNLHSFSLAMGPTLFFKPFW